MIKLPAFKYFLPFYIFDLNNFQIITSQFIPGDIADTKDIVYTETPIPGLNYQPVQSGGMGNRKIAFTLPLVKRDGIIGNVALLKQFDNLRQPSGSFVNIFKKDKQFTPNPKVLFSWGIGSIPLIWFVKKCDATHKKSWVNSFGQPQYSEIHIELILDESNVLNKAEDIFRQLASWTGIAEGIYGTVKSFEGTKAF